jgi:NADPH:quinone reductase-like Zn-dependent oxidoreductase
LISNAKLKPGETMLIIGIGGGVTSASLQVAKKIGAQAWFYIRQSANQKGPVTFDYDLASGSGAVKRGFRV